MQILSEKRQEYVEVLRHYFTQCVCTGHAGIGHSLRIYIMNSCYHIQYHHTGVINQSYCCTVPSAPKTEGGSSWYKSMFRSMLANDDEGTLYYHLYC